MTFVLKKKLGEVDTQEQILLCDYFHQFYKER